MLKSYLTISAFYLILIINKIKKICVDGDRRDKHSVFRDKTRRLKGFKRGERYSLRSIVAEPRKVLSGNGQSPLSDKRGFFKAN